MADDKDVSVKELCYYCNKSVSKKFIKCLTCDKIFHNSCSVRVTCCGVKLGIKTSQEKDSNTVDVVTEDNNLSLVTLNEELKTENYDLKEENKKLKQQIIHLEEKLQKLLTGKVHPNKCQNDQRSEENQYHNNQIQTLIARAVKKNISPIVYWRDFPEISLMN